MTFSGTILGLDLSTKSGWGLVGTNGEALEYGLIQVKVDDFNVNDFPDHSPKYPYNIIDAANSLASQVMELVRLKKPDSIVIENTVKGRNRHTQRILEFIHKAVLENLRTEGLSFVYRDPSAWRKTLEIRLTKDDKQNNKLVSQGKKRGRIGKKHLSVRLANDLFGTKFIMKNNDVAEALLLARALYEERKLTQI